MKRVLSAFLALVMIASMFPLGVFATEENTATEPTTSVDTSSVEIGGGGLGTLISNAVEDEAATEEEDVNIENKILEVTMEEDMAFVEFNNTVECKIIVSLYDENTGAMLCSGIEENIAPHTGSIYVAIDTDAMPEYYIVKAFLLDMENVALHRSYENTHYTTEFQEFLAKTTDDFESDRILNFDSNKSNNFAVFSDSTIVITESEYNILESADEENLVYTFTNTNEEITTLVEGDVVYFENDETTVILRVATVTVDGTTATITGSEDIAMDAIFSYVKIDSTIPDDTVVPVAYSRTATSSEEHTVPGFVPGKEYTGTQTVSINASFYPYNDVSVSIEGTLNLKAELRVFIFPGLYCDAYMGLEEELSASFSVNAEFPLYEYSLGEVSVPLFAGVEVALEPKLVIEFNIKFEGEITQTATVAYSYYDTLISKGEITNKSKPPIVEIEAALEGEFYLGLKLEPKVEIIEIFSSGFEGELGAKLTCKAPLITDNSKYHYCTALCVECDLDIVFKFGVFAKASIKNVFDVDYKATIGVATGNILEFYYSDDLGFGVGKCPNYSYNVTLLIIDKDGVPIANATVNDTFTNEKGIAELGYLPKGIHTITVTKDGLSRVYEIEVTEPGKITVVLEPTKWTDPSLFTYDVIDGSATITGIDSSFSGDMVIPEVIDGYLVTYIGESAFENNTSITSAVIPNFVKTIGRYAFQNCTELTSVVLGNTVNLIRLDVFKNCTKLTDIVIPDSVTTIGREAFYNTCYYNDESNWENGVLYIDNHLIKAKTSISGYYAIKEGTVTIAIYAFQDCSDLQGVAIPDSVTTVGNAAFYNCTGLEYVEMSDNTKKIGELAFYYCKSLSGILIPDKTESIGMGVFWHCSGLKEVIIGNGVKEIGDRAFLYTNLNTVYYTGSTLDWTNISIGMYNSELTSITPICNYTPIASFSLYPSTEIMVADDSTTSEITNTYITETLTETDLVPGAVYTMMLLYGTEEEYTVDTTSLIYITDTEADETGTATFSYIYDETLTGFVPVVFGLCNHYVTDWITVNEPTYTEVGDRVKMCVKCSDVMESEEIEVLPLPELKLSSAALELSSDLTVHFKANITMFDAYTSPSIEVTLNDETTVIDEFTESDGMYVFSFENIAPDLMNDTITAVLTAQFNGEMYTYSTEYSIAEYCYNMLEQYSADEYAEFRTLLVDLLNYGAASQTYSEHDTDNLANAALTAEQLEWGTSEAPVLETVLNREYATTADPTVTWKGAGLNLNKSIEMRFKISADSVDGLTVKITNDAGNEWTADAFEEIDNGYYIYFDGLGIAQMSEPVYLTVYNGDTAVSNTLRYSIESYACAMQDYDDTALADLVVAMMKYGNAAMAYVTE